MQNSCIQCRGGNCGCIDVGLFEVFLKREMKHSSCRAAELKLRLCSLSRQLHFFVSSWPCPSSTTDALQPGCVHTRPAGVPAEASDPAAAQRSTCRRRLPSPASIQPSFCCTTTLAWIVDVRAAAIC